MTEDIWTIKRILQWIEGYLAQHNDESPRASAQWLVSEALGISRMQLFLDAERPLNQDERAVLRDWTKRRAAGEPLQYITGQTAFRHITVNVRKGVLIPRPETEVLVSEALALLPAAPKPQDQLDTQVIQQYMELGGHIDEDQQLSEPVLEQQLLVADICTGTGCIACSLAYEHPGTQVIATDISSVAVALAKENVHNLQLDERVSVLECDLGEGIDASLLGKLHVVVSNPPYVPTKVLADIPREVADFEPSLALDGGADGLDIFRRLLTWCLVALRPGGAFAFELHETCLDDAATLARQAGYENVRIVRDLTERPRVLTARKPTTQEV